MKQIIYISLILLFFSGSVLNAQNTRRNEDLRDRFRTEKISFLTEQMELTPTEAQKFWPVYNELQGKIWEVQRARHDIDVRLGGDEGSLSKEEIIQLTKDYSSSMQEEGSLLKEYNEKFLKILSPEKVLKLYQAENGFRFRMMNMLRNRERTNREENN